MQNRKIAVISTKGGVGKSTVSMQLLAPYLYEKSNQAVSFFEFDDENEDSVSFEKSRLVWIEKVKVEGSDLRAALRDILLLPNNIVIDVGANKTAVMVLDALVDSGMIYALDAVVIPLMDGELDATSALAIYNRIKKVHNEMKFLFVLNRWNENRDLNSQFDIFLGDRYSFFKSKAVIEYINEPDRNYIVLADSDAIKYTRAFGVTLWEFAKERHDFETELKRAIKAGDTAEQIQMLSFKKALKSDSISYKERILDPAFEKLDRLFGDYASSANRSEKRF